MSTQTTSKGALSTSSRTMIRPVRAARTSGDSFSTMAPSSSEGATVRLATLVSRCSCAYSRSAFNNSHRRSASLFLPTPWLPMSKIAVCLADMDRARPSSTVVCVSLGKYRGRGMSCGSVGVRRGSVTRPIRRSAPLLPTATSRAFPCTTGGAAPAPASIPPSCT